MPNVFPYEHLTDDMAEFQTFRRYQEKLINSPSLIKSSLSSE